MKKNYNYTQYCQNTKPSKKIDPNHPGFLTRPHHDVFPEDIDCVIEGGNGKGAIYIGNLQAAQNLQTLKKFNIQSLLTACKNIHIRHPKNHVPYALYIPGEDHEKYDISVHFDTALNFIHKSLQQTNILVHCMAGVSRSVTLVLAYLMKHKGMSYNEAFKTVQSKRRIINPNPGFIRQLKALQQSLKGPNQRQRQSLETRYSPSHQDHRQRIQSSNQYSSYKNKINQSASIMSSPSKPLHYNPEYDIPRYNQAIYSTGNQLTNSNVRYSAQKGATPIQNKLGNILTKCQNYTTVTQNRSKLRQSSYQVLSKQLDQRIAKIKQKYYECEKDMSKNRQNYKYGQQYTPKYEINKTAYYQHQFLSKKYNNYLIGEFKGNAQNDLRRSTVIKEGLRQSNYSPYKSNFYGYH